MRDNDIINLRVESLIKRNNFKAVLLEQVTDHYGDRLAIDLSLVSTMSHRTKS